MVADILDHLMPAIVREQAPASGDDDIMYVIKSDTEEGIIALSLLKEKRTSVFVAYRNYYNSVKSVFGEEVL